MPCLPGSQGERARSAHSSISETRGSSLLFPHPLPSLGSSTDHARPILPQPCKFPALNSWLSPQMQSQLKETEDPLSSEHPSRCTYYITFLDLYGEGVLSPAPSLLLENLTFG